MAQRRAIMGGWGVVCTLSPLLLHKSQHTGTFVTIITIYMHFSWEKKQRGGGQLSLFLYVFFSHLNLLWLQSFAKVRHDTGQLRSIYEPIAILPELVIWNNPCHIFTLENYYFVEDNSPHQRPGRLPLFRPLHSQPLPTFWPKPLLEWTKVTYLITVPSQKPTPSLLWHGCCYVCMNELLVLPCSPSWPETQESWATQSHPYPPLPPYPDFFKGVVNQFFSLQSPPFIQYWKKMTWISALDGFWPKTRMIPLTWVLVTLPVSSQNLMASKCRKY